MQSALAGRLATDIASLHVAQSAALDALGHGPTLDQQRAMADLAARHRELFADLELSVPHPEATATPARYRVELLSRLQRFSPTFRNTDLRRLAAAGLDGLEQEIVRDARRVAADKTVGSFRRPGALREILRTDAAGQTTADYYGKPIAWMAEFVPPVTMVEAVVDPRTGRRLWR